jgi:hypothetical protein
VSDDASLDEFLDAGGDDRSDGADAAESPADAESDAGGDDGDEADAGGPDTDAVAPATATATWSPDGATCAACGDVVERRWRDGEALVCADCKEW